MRAKIVTSLGTEDSSDLARYWAGLRAVLPAVGIATDVVSLKAWQGGRGGADPAQDLVLVAAHEAPLIQKQYAVVALALDCAMERGLRCRQAASLEQGKLELAAGARDRTFWVAASDWTAHRTLRHAGVRADRIIYGPVDVDTMIPSERQRIKRIKTAVVWHAASGPARGQHLLPDLTTALRGRFELRELRCAPAAIPELLREGDIWLSLDAATGLPMGVQDALSCGLVVLGADTGILWSHADGVPVRDAGMLVWLNEKVGAAVFDWQQRDYPDVIADHIRWVWGQRYKLTNGRDYAREHWGLRVFGQKWQAALQLAAQRFGLK